MAALKRVISGWSPSRTASGSSSPRPIIDATSEELSTASSSASTHLFSPSSVFPPVCRNAVYCSPSEHSFGSCALATLHAAQRFLPGSDHVIDTKAVDGTLSICNFWPNADNVVDAHRVTTIRNALNLESRGYNGDTTFSGLYSGIDRLKFASTFLPGQSVGLIFSSHYIHFLVIRTARTSAASPRWLLFQPSKHRGQTYLAHFRKSRQLCDHLAAILKSAECTSRIVVQRSADVPFETLQTCFRSYVTRDCDEVLSGKQRAREATVHPGYSSLHVTNPQVFDLPPPAYEAVPILTRDVSACSLPLLGTAWPSSPSDQYDSRRVRFANSAPATPSCSTFTCPICMDKVTCAEEHKLEQCGHSICRQDLKQYLEAASQWPVHCPICVAERSRTPTAVSMQEAEGLLDEIGLEELRRKMVRALAVQVGCPGCGTSYLLDKDDWDATDLLLCPCCSTVVCKSCRAIVKKNRRHKCIDDERFERLLAKQGWVRCPSCRAPTEKQDGCQHIHCKQCLAHWCYAPKCKKRLLTHSQLPHIVSQAVQEHDCRS